MVQKRFNFAPETVELYAEKVANRGLCAVAQAESLRYKLLGGLAVRRCALLCFLGWRSAAALARQGGWQRVVQHLLGSRAVALQQAPLRTLLRSTAQHAHAAPLTTPLPPGRATACCASSWSLAPRAAR